MSLNEKDALLKEVHHRVKNNMQVVSSLLNLQLDFLSDEQARPFILDTQSRIAAMALVHEKLYQSTDLARVDFADYLRELTENIVGTYSSAARDVSFVLEAEDILLGIDTAVPCGLLVNELISNAYKHGLSGGHGTVTVTLRRDLAGRILLRVADTGRGLPAGIDLEKTESLGMQLVYILMRQLDGTLDVESAPGRGTCFTLTLPDVPAKTLTAQSS